MLAGPGNERRRTRKQSLRDRAFGGSGELRNRDTKMEPEFPLSSFDLRGLYLMLRRHLRLVGLATGLGLMLALALLALIPAQYTATTVLMVDGRRDRARNDPAAAANRMASSTVAGEAAAIVAPGVLRRVADKLVLAKDPDYGVAPNRPGLFGTAKAQLFLLFGIGVREPNPGDGLSDEMLGLIESLRKSIEVVSSQYTSLLHVSVTSRDPRKAASVANAVAEAYFDEQREMRHAAARRAAEQPQELPSARRVPQRAAEENFEPLGPPVQETSRLPTVRIVAAAVPPLAPSQPKAGELLLGGLALGLGLGLGLTLLTELLDRTFKRGRDVEASLAMPHLANVPLLPLRLLSAGGPARTPGQNAFHFAAQHIGSPFADAMFSLLSSLQSTTSRNAQVKTIMFTSAMPSEGKSVVAANFAQTAARSGFKVLLICADLRTPGVNWFEPNSKPAADLADYLNGKAEIEAAIARSDQAMIDLISTAPSAANAASLLASPRMQKLLAWAKARYDVVVIDTPAVVPCVDGRMLARHVDATVVVVEWLRTRIGVAKEAVDLLLKNDAGIAGVVLNKVDFSKARLYGLNTSA